jgi:hypothetical protein
MATLSIGQINVPSDWEVRTQITYIEPPDVMEVPLAVQQTQARPRSNIVVSRSHTAVATTDQALDDFLTQTAQAVPGLKSLDRGTLSFDDGEQASCVTISFNATPQVRLVQRHIFRIDDGVLTQIVATVDDGHLADLDGRMQQIVRSLKL